MLGQDNYPSSSRRESVPSVNASDVYADVLHSDGEDVDIPMVDEDGATDIPDEFGYTQGNSIRVKRYGIAYSLVMIETQCCQFNSKANEVKGIQF